MLVSEYVLQIIEKRPYKYSTKLTNVADVKRLGIWNMDTSEIHSGMIHERVDKIANHNSRKRLYITARSMFKDLGICQDLPYLELASQEYLTANTWFGKETLFRWTVELTQILLPLITWYEDIRPNHLSIDELSGGYCPIFFAINPTLIGK